MRVLLLNANFRPIDTITFEDVIDLFMRAGDVVEPVEGVAGVMRSPSTTIKIPSVLRLKIYKNVPMRKKKWSKWGVLKRDNFSCVYCSKKSMSRDECTVDHIIPVAQEGKSTWGNTACACLSCNQRKADRTPSQAGMKLRWEPKTPRTNYLVLSGEVPSEWKKYLKY